MAQFIKSLLGSLGAGLLLLGGPIIVGTLALLQSVPWYLMALAILAAPGIVLWSFLQVKNWGGLRHQTVEQSGEIIRKWLDHTKLSVANSPTPEAYYRYTVSLGPRSVSVYRRKSDPEMVMFGINLHVPKVDYATLDSMTDKRDSMLIKDLRLELARLGIQYSGLSHPLRSISFVDDIIFDHNLTRSSFLEKIELMIRAQVILGEIIDREAKLAGVSLTMSSS